MSTIIYVSPHSDLYGAERSLLSMMLQTRQRGYHPVLLLSHHGKIEEELRKKKIDYYLFPFWQSINMEGHRMYIRGVKSVVNNALCAYKAKKILQKKYHDIVLVHTNSLITDFGVLLSSVLSVPHIQHIREFGKQDFDMEFNFGKRLVGKIFNRSKKIICISQAVYYTYAEIFDCRKMVCIYNGIKEPEQPVVPECKCEAIKILLIGRLSKEKGQIEVIEACKLLTERGIHNFELHLYGSGRDEEKLKRYVSEHHMESHVHFMGFSNNINYGEYDIAVMASKAEAFGRVTVEYMLYGLPVVGINSGGTKEIVDNGNTGLLSEWGDIQTMADHMQQLILDVNLRHRLGESGKERARVLFSEKVYGENIASIYREVLEADTGDNK